MFARGISSHDGMTQHIHVHRTAHTTEFIKPRNIEAFLNIRIEIFHSNYQNCTSKSQHCRHISARSRNCYKIKFCHLFANHAYQRTRRHRKLAHCGNWTKYAYAGKCLREERQCPPKTTNAQTHTHARA